MTMSREEYRQQKLMVDHHLKVCRERSGSVVECMTRDGGTAGFSLTGVTAV